ncbi:RadC family protein [Aliiruegeria sabulilitoris]|uniref:RadC family protein n=1 Tax=Aliiruegeria sabulilitoris TaxID=1510458 RepID=UPI000831326A|nr:DNA repair protein RadC [Aliiruegeria sabulilitoris]NDR57476.1 JAB domain-containing protein [Pseudoruegeria sp. M32A2M]
MTIAQAFSESALPLFGTDEAPLPPQQTHSVAPMQPSYLKDHRQRLRERFLQAGPKSVPDYELLELVLFRAVPRHDVKPLARKLIETFGDFNRVISAPASRLQSVPGVGTMVILELKIVEASAQRLSRAKILRRPVLTCWDSLLDYCHTNMAHRETEHFRVLFLDCKNTLLADEDQGHGTVDHVPVYPREVVKRALELNASALILVHNHPSGDPTPSAADVAMTEKMVNAAEALGLTIHDHLVIGREAEFSFRSAGYL